MVDEGVVAGLQRVAYVLCIILMATLAGWAVAVMVPCEVFMAIDQLLANPTTIADKASGQTVPTAAAIEMDCARRRGQQPQTVRAHDRRREDDQRDGGDGTDP